MINTDLSALVMALEEKEGIKLSEAAQRLELSEHETERLAKMLVEYKILEIHYSLKGHKILKKGAMPAKTEEKERTLHKKHHVSAETERAVNYLRYKIAEKRNNKTEETERQKRLKEIKEGLAEVRQNLENIRNSIKKDQTEKQGSFNAMADAVITQIE